MSFIRGKYYTWHDGKYTHLPEKMPNKTFDELVVMRFAELSEKEVEKAEKRAIKNYSGNFGCDALSKKHGLKTIMEKLDTNKN